jgi:hypothetical protein
MIKKPASKQQITLKRFAPSGDMVTTQLTRLCTRVRYTRGLFALVAVETQGDSAHDEVLCHRLR